MPSSSFAYVENCQWCFFFAHPGHELRVHHALERARPTVAVLTDGSGSTGVPRLVPSMALLEASGARVAPIFGELSDRAAYTALLDVDAAPFVALRNRLAQLLSTGSVDAVLVDAAEGYNPAHDICHWIGRAAVQQARDGGAVIDVFELDLVSHPDGDGAGVRLTLDDSAFARKLRAVGAYDALAHEATAAFAQYGRDAFRVEFLRRVMDSPAPPLSWVPHYEEVGEARVRSGRYASVLRYAQHVRPVIEMLLASPSLHAEDLSSSHQ